MRYLITNAKSGLSLAIRNGGLCQEDPGNLQNALWTLLPRGFMDRRRAPTGDFFITMGMNRIKSSHKKDDGVLSLEGFSDLQDDDRALWQLPSFVDEHGSVTMNLIDLCWNKAIVVGADGNIHHVDPIIKNNSAARWALIPFGD